MTSSSTASPGLTRRHVGCAALGCAAVPLLAACGSDDAEAPESAGESEASDSPSEEQTTDSAGGGLVAVADVPVGGGVVVANAEVVVTQPTEGEFRGYSVVCTHQGCAVNKVENGTIQCPCHGSAFDVADGSVVNGPATSPLEEVEVTVEGDQVVKA